MRMNWSNDQFQNCWQEFFIHFLLNGRERKMRDTTMGKKLLTKMLWLASGVALAFPSSCTMDDPFATTNIKAVFRLKSQTALEGRITIDEAYLKLSHIEATGNLPDGKMTDITHSIPAEEPPFKLTTADSSELNFTLPSGIYDQLDFNLFLFHDTYGLVMMANAPAETPDPAQNDDQDSTGQQDGEGNTDNGNNTDTDDNPGSQEDEDDNDNGDGGDTNGGVSNDNDEGKNNDGKGKGKKDDHTDKKKDKKKGDKAHGGRNAHNGITDQVNLRDFFQNAKPGMVVIGTYKNNDKTMRLIFVASGIEKFTLPGKQNDSFSVILADRNTAEITFDPERWFSSVRPADIESASTQLYQGETVLFIHQDFNGQIYQALVPHLEESTDLTFEGNNF